MPTLQRSFNFSPFTTSVANKRLVKEAYLLANQAHAGQWRKGNANEVPEPYIIHPMRLALILYKLNELTQIFGESEAELFAQIIASVLLHDTIEDTVVTHDDIASQFGNEVAEIVGKVTKPSKGTANYDRLIHEYHAVIEASGDAVRMVKSTDRIDNMFDCLKLDIGEVKNREFVGKCAMETRQIYLRIAEKTNDLMFAALRYACDVIDEKLATYR